MSHGMETGNSIQPLRTVVVMNALIERLNNRAFGLPNIGVLHGPPGYGKTFAAMFATARHEAIHISARKSWTHKTLLKKLLFEFGQPENGTISDLEDRVSELLNNHDRPLIIDEVDYLIDKGLLPVLRDFADAAPIPVIMIGMEQLPQKLKKWPVVSSRVLHCAAAQPADLADARRLAQQYAPDVSVADDLLEYVLERNTGNIRISSANLAHIQETALTWGKDELNLADWGDTPFPDFETPTPRSYLK
jgi:DNA transposition AAA+ family ATPase